MSSVRLRRARLADLDALLALEALFPSDRMTRPTLRRFLRHPSAQLWVAAQGRQLVGDLLLLFRRGSDSARIYSVVVAPQARGQGLGERLIARAERAATAAGCKRIKLEVRRRNRPAQALYAKRGYQLVKALPGYYEDGSDGLRLAKELC